VGFLTGLIDRAKLLHRAGIGGVTLLWLGS
jgi:hypothetical protein